MSLRRRAYLFEADEIETTQERFHIGPFKITVVRAKGDELSDRFKEFVKRYVPQVARNLKRAGVRMKMPEIYVKDEKSLAGSSFDIPMGVHITGVDAVVITGFMGMSSPILTHEIGHRVFTLLPQRAKKYWQEVIEPRSVAITRDDVQKFKEKYFRNKEFHRAKDYKAYVRDREEDVRTSAVFQELAGAFPDSWGWVWTGSKEDYEKVKVRLKEKIGKKVFVARIPFSLFHYAAKNPHEAFAEFFTNYVEKGPRQSDPAMRSIFKNVMGAGGHRMEDRMGLRQRSYLGEAKPSRAKKNKSYRMGFELGSSERLSERSVRYVHRQEERREIFKMLGGKSFRAFEDGYFDAWDVEHVKSSQLFQKRKNRFWSQYNVDRGGYRSIRDIREDPKVKKIITGWTE